MVGINNPVHAKIAIIRQIIEITTANAFPAAMIAVQAVGDDENLRIQARNVTKALEQIKGVDRVDTVALDDPEINVKFDTDALEALGLVPDCSPTCLTVVLLKQLS